MELESESELDDLAKSDNNNLTRYLGLNTQDICLEINLSNFTNYKSNRETLNQMINLELYNTQINACEQELDSNVSNSFNIPGINKWVETDSNGEKYFAYTIGKNIGEIKIYKYEHMEQGKNILLEFIDFVENNYI